VGVILTGWLIFGLGLSGSAPLGGILMLAGALIGAWHWLKFVVTKVTRPWGDKFGRLESRG